MIAFSHVTKAYGDRLVVDDVSMIVEKAAFVVLVGQSGAGKTSLLKAVNRLVQIDGGSVRIDGEDVAAMQLTDLRRRVGYVFQGVGLFPHMSVAQNIWIGPRLRGTPDSARPARVAELLELVSLPADLAERLPAQLSGGQAQRVGFARALAANPEIMLMDEPFGALDPVTRRDLGLAYRALHDRMGLTSLLVTHDMAEALRLADRIVVVGDGKILADLPPAELLQFRGDERVCAMIDVVREGARHFSVLERNG
ncbi:ATP-binding cassette domain-containing protein [Sandaracinobacteroides hominis]|uniref:ATP-binding cassette domain-containing protein n=1 Tax=Sandaracinobacteroides hominis TaxID=2780086 RepID=UPI0018F37D7E|nr:ABC transporter ATP-binding protein [Sandaracinobacteroides hominis]